MAIIKCSCKKCGKQQYVSSSIDAFYCQVCGEENKVGQTLVEADVGHESVECDSTAIKPAAYDAEELTQDRAFVCKVCGAVNTVGCLDNGFTCKKCGKGVFDERTKSMFEAVNADAKGMMVANVIGRQLEQKLRSAALEEPSCVGDFYVEVSYPSEVTFEEAEQIEESVRKSLLQDGRFVGLEIISSFKFFAVSCRASEKGVRHIREIYEDLPSTKKYRRQEKASTALETACCLFEFFPGCGCVVAIIIFLCIISAIAGIGS